MLLVVSLSPCIVHTTEQRKSVIRKTVSTKIINLFGGPGCGKSTSAAGLFYKMKNSGLSVELINEYAKDLTWEERHGTLACQPYVFGKQLWKIQRLIGQVDYVITDSPLLLSVIYNTSYPESFNLTVKSIFSSFDNLNFLLRRKKKYVEVGRNQTEKEAIAIDGKIENLLLREIGTYTPVGGWDLDPADEICKIMGFEG